MTWNAVIKRGGMEEYQEEGLEMISRNYTNNFLDTWNTKG